MQMRGEATLCGCAQRRDSTAHPVGSNGRFCGPGNGPQRPMGREGRRRLAGGCDWRRRGEGGAGRGGAWALRH